LVGEVVVRGARVQHRGQWELQALIVHAYALILATILATVSDLISGPVD
jgi:hypothetical protein